MNLFTPLAALLGIEAESIVARTKAAVVVYATIAVFCILAVSFLIAAAYIALAAAIGPLYASLAFAGVFAALALAVYVGALIAQGRRRKEMAQRRKSSEAGAFVTTAALTALPAIIRSPLLVRLGLPAAAVAALMIVRGGRDD